MSEVDEEALVLLQGELLALDSTFGGSDSPSLGRIRLRSGDGQSDRDLGDVVGNALETVHLPLMLQIRIDPTMCGEAEMVSYVQFTLNLLIGKGYPHTPDMRVTVDQQKGLDCLTECRLQDRLAERLREDVLVGDMHGCGSSIVPMVFYAVELAQEYNAPHGACVFCLEDLNGSDGGDHHGKGVTKLDPCFHCFHTMCFQRWYAWKQQDIRRKVNELYDAHNKNALIVSKAMKDQGIEESKHHPGTYIVCCPCCRGPVYDIPEHILIDTDSMCTTSLDEDVGMYSVRNLPITLRENVEKLQQRFSKLVAIQQEHDGLII